MKDSLSQASAEAIRQLMEWLKQGGEYVGAQAPDIARQYLAWYRWTSVVELVVYGAMTVLMLAVVFALYPRVLREWHKDLLDQAPEVTMLGTISMIACSIGACIAGSAAMTDINLLIKVTLSPKIVLLEGLSGLMR